MPPEKPSVWLNGSVKIGVVGAHLSGPLNYQLTERGARLIRTTRTATDKHNVRQASPDCRAGLRWPSIEIEVWLMRHEKFGSFVAAIPPQLGIGTCLLEDGELVAVRELSAAVVLLRE
jgi:allophanate hydrolase